MSHFEGDATLTALHELKTDGGFRLWADPSRPGTPGGVMLRADTCYVDVRPLDDYFDRSGA